VETLFTLGLKALSKRHSFVKHSKRGAAVIALITVLGLFALKLVVGWITGSISIFAQMADSFLDILSVALTFIAIIMATRPADSGHPFGHGKLETFLLWSRLCLSS